MSRCTVQQSVISNQRSGELPAKRRIANRNHMASIRRSETEMQEIAITRPQFDETELHEVHTNRTRTEHNRMAFRRQLRARQRRHSQSSELGVAMRRASLPASSVGLSGEAVRGCRRVHQRQQPAAAQPLPLPERLGGIDKLTSSGHHSQRCCFHTDRPTDKHTHGTQTRTHTADTHKHTHTHR